MEKINIAELLKDCPKGMELNCLMFGDVTLYNIDTNTENDYPIRIETKYGDLLDLTKYGTYTNVKEANCVIFPKGKTTWEGFQRPFKDGDILINGNPFIFKQTNGLGNAQCYCAINYFEELILNSDNWTPIKGCRLATEEEKEKLFQAIKDNGYQWNPKTKTLEKLPKFKVGDRIRHKKKTKWTCVIRRIDDRYWVDEHPMCYTLPFGKQDEYELVSNKFDITTLKPFDKVLVRDVDDEEWTPNFYGYKRKEFQCVLNNWHQCIPYEGNEHLLGTTNDCDEYYKTWK